MLRMRLDQFLIRVHSSRAWACHRPRRKGYHPRQSYLACGWIQCVKTHLIHALQFILKHPPSLGRRYDCPKSSGQSEETGITMVCRERFRHIYSSWVCLGSSHFLPRLLGCLYRAFLLFTLRHAHVTSSRPFIPKVQITDPHNLRLLLKVPAYRA
jgi:hypothetical protein